MGESMEKGLEKRSVSFSRSALSNANLKISTVDVSDNQASRNMWQVYALGGFLVGQWLWARWSGNRRRRDFADE